MVRTLFWLVVIVASGAGQDADTVVHAPEAGFELAIADVGWIHRAERGPDDLTALAIGPEAHEGLVQLSVQVSTVSADDPDAAADAVAALRAAIANEPSITNVEPLELMVAERVAPGIEVVQTAGGETFRAYVAFLHARGIQYRFQFHAPRATFDEHWPIARGILDGFRLIELDESARRRVRWRELAARCGTQVEWAASWEEAAQRARDERRLVVVAIHAQPGFELGNALDEQVFMSPDVIELVRHRFVVWKWNAGREAPFVDHAVFGLSQTTFGVGLLVCTPEPGNPGMSSAFSRLDRFSAKTFWTSPRSRTLVA